MPKVSVIVPVYNTEQYLMQCLDSILSQTLKDIEVICVNDSSSDNSLEILNKYANKDNRIIVINQLNQGACIARNNGLKAATGEYVGFVDSDDWIDKNFYELLYNSAKEKNADIARTTYKYVYPYHEIPEKNLGKCIEEKFSKGEDLSVNNHSVVIWNAIYRTKMLKDNHIDYFDNIAGAHDIPFTARATYYSKRTVPVIGTYYNYRKNVANQLSVFSTKRINYIKSSNKITLGFINSVNYNSQEDYLLAYKKCLERYHNAFMQGLTLSDFTTRQQKELFKDMVIAIKNCKQREKLLNNYKERYYKYLIQNNFRGYLKSINKHFAKDIIVSLTSYPARINHIEPTIKSLLKQSIRPQKIILALSENKFPNKENDLPEGLKHLLSDKFEILWTKKDLRPYTKLIPTLKNYRNKIIVTADDDIIYKKDWLEKLYCAYKRNPKLIHCHRAHRIIFDKDKNLLPYKEWKLSIKDVKPSYNNFLTGVGGVLYPPNSLYKDVFNEELFQELSPYADDIWFWAMAVLNNVKINVIKDNYIKLNYAENTQETALWRLNVAKNKNDEQLANVLNHYPQILKKLDKRTFKQPTKIVFPYKLFSISNSQSKKGKWNKVIYILGIKFSFRNKRKEKRELRKSLKNNRNL